MSITLEFTAVLLLTSVPLAFSQNANKKSAPKHSETQQQIGNRSTQDAGQRKTLLLKDFKPVSMLHTPVHEVERAKYYVIDVHNHVNDARGTEEHRPPQRVIQVMDNTNVKTVVILTGMWGKSCSGSSTKW
jgi:hypothetical protein